MIKEALLGLLATQPMHGYDLKVSLETVLGQTSKVNVGQVYTAIGKLEKEGLVAAALKARDERTDMKVYSLTAAGVAHLQRWFASPVAKVDLRDELFMKLVLARRSGRADVAAIVRTQRTEIFRSIQELTILKAHYEEAPDPETVLLLEGAILHLEADLQWLDLWERRSSAGS